MEKIYLIDNQAIIRTPLLHIDKYKEVFIENENTKELLKEFKEWDVFKEALLIGSKDLYDTVSNFTIESLPDEVVRALEKYLIRATSRSTPFGLFAGLNVINITQDRTNIKLRKEEVYEKNIQVDYQWLNDLTKDIEKKCYEKLKFIKNNTLIDKGIKLENFNVCQKESKVYVKNSELLKLVLKNTEKQITYNQLLTIIKHSYPDVDDIIIKNYIEELIKLELIISNLRIPLVNTDSLTYLKTELLNAKLPEYVSIITMLEEKITYYKSKKMGSGIEAYLELIEFMESIKKSKSYLKIDLKINFQEDNLDENLLMNLPEAVDLITYFSVIQSEKDKLNGYREAFIDKFGNFEIPLFKVIDEFDGIGMNLHTDSKNSINHLNNLILKNLDDSQDIFLENLSESIDKEKLENILKRKKLPHSLEIGINIKKESDKNLVFIGPAMSLMKEKILGRFKYMFSKDIYKDLVPDNNDIENIEINFYPNKGLLGNVTNCYSNCEYQISISNNSSGKEISLEDIHIGNDAYGLYLKSKKLNKRLNIINTNVVNDKLAPPIFKYLKDISNYGSINNFKALNTINFTNLSYIPRISYKNIVLRGKSWIIDDEYLNIKNKNFSEFSENLKSYIDKKRIDNIVYLVEGDNKLLINLNNKNMINILYERYKKSNRKSMLTEIDFNIDNTIVKDEFNRNLNSEIIIPLINKNIENRILNDKSNRYYNNTEIRNVTVGQEWLYFKLYCYENYSDEIIFEYIPRVIENINKNLKNKVEYFYIRYADPKHHIRFRIKLNDNDFSIIIKSVISELRDLTTGGVIKNYIIDTYEREVERYGGIDAIGEAEKLFIKDSKVTTELLKICKQKKLDKEIVGILSIMKYLESIGLTYPERLEYMDLFIDRNEYRKEFTEKRKILIELFKNKEEFENHLEYKDIYILLKERDITIKEYMNTIKRLDKENKFIGDKNRLIKSLLHMFCNRFYGIDLELEKKIYALVRHTIYAVKYFKK